MSSTYTGWQSGVDFDYSMGYRRTDNLFPTFRFNKGTSNLLVEDDNEGVVVEKI